MLILFYIPQSLIIRSISSLASSFEVNSRCSNPYFLHNFSSKRNKNRLFHLSSLFRKKYTNFTSLCKSENLSKKENFSKILLTGSFPQAKFYFYTLKSLDFPWKTILLHSYHKVFHNLWGKWEKSRADFVGYTKCTKEAVEKDGAESIFSFFVWLWEIYVI